MKKMIYLLAAALVVGSFGFKPAGNEAKILKHPVAIAKKMAKKKAFTDVYIYPYNPVQAQGLHLKLVKDITLETYDFEISNVDPSAVGHVPPGSYTATIYNPYIYTDQYYTLGIAEYTSYGTSATFVSILLNADTTVSITE